MTLEILTSDALLPAHHGFFTRKGGASSGIFGGLNCGVGSSDQREVVDINRARVAEAMNNDCLASIHQIHSADVVVADTPAETGQKADAMVTATKGVVLTILTADCQPVLFNDPDAGVIGAAHAGWKGAIGGVLENTVAAMERLGAKRDNIRAVIGPCISQPAYEVGPEFYEQFIEHDAEYRRFFVDGTDGRMQFDLPSFGLACLRGAGIGDASWTGHCTYSDESRFYSYRRATHNKEADYGRLISSIRL
jgi:YfiH family protein